jgi:hypothetical protein
LFVPKGTVKTTHYCSEVHVLCLARTGVLKAEPKGKVGDDSDNISQQEDDKDLMETNLVLWQSCARQSNVNEERGIPRNESITSGLSGDCLVYSLELIYIWVVHGPCIRKI